MKVVVEEVLVVEGRVVDVVGEMVMMEVEGMVEEEMVV